MNRSVVDRIVAATLYEGYILYPYRASSVKNQVRWTFGGVFPRAYSDATGGSEPWTATTECLVRGDDGTDIDVRVRFLHVVTRSVARLAEPTPEPTPEALHAATAEASLEVDGVTHRSWEEAAERELDAGVQRLGDLLGGARHLSLSVPAGREVEWLRAADGMASGALLREHRALAVNVDIRAERVAPDIRRVGVTISNVTAVTDGDLNDRSGALRHALVSTHAILGTEKGSWLSLTDPPADAAEAAAQCRNTGLWPVLVGEAGAADTILASPIILEDHPQLAPESPGDLFDATEIDEILSLRILTLTDAEKEEMRSADERARAMLDRTERLTQDDFMRMHGVVRSTPPLVRSADE